MGKKKSLVLMIIAVVLIFLGVLLTVLDVMHEDKNEEKESIQQLTKHYDQFMSYANQFNDVRKDYYSIVINDLYDESVKDNYNLWLEHINTYQKLMDQIIESAQPLTSLCINKIYGDHQVNNQCRAYVINYETFMNYFVKDINEFNEFIESYLRKYATDDNNIKVFELDPDKYYYIDVDDDGEFIGKD